MKRKTQDTEPKTLSPDYARTFPRRYSKGINAAARTMEIAGSFAGPVGYLAVDPAFWRDSPRVYFSRDLGELFSDIVSDGWTPEVPGPLIEAVDPNPEGAEVNPTMAEAERSARWFRTAIEARIRRVYGGRGSSVETRQSDSGSWSASAVTADFSLRWSALARSEVLALGRLLLSIPASTSFGPETDGEVPRLPAERGGR